MSPKSINFYQKVCQFTPGGVNSPVRAFNGVGGNPLFIDRGEGAFLIDVAGRRYIDYVGSWGPLILGHAHPEVVNALEETAQKGLSFGAPTPLEVSMAELLCARIPSLEKVRMVNSGTEATMTAIRLARGFTKRDKILKFKGCYHGHADPFLIQGGSGLLTLGVASSAGIPESIAADILTANYNSCEEVETLFQHYGSQIAAVIVEPIAGNMNCVLSEPSFLPFLRKITQEYDSVLIFDEVITGFRVGPQGAQGLFDIVPDLTTLGKIIGGGMPVGAVGGKRAIMDLLAPLGPVYQAGTLSGNPIAMACGLATLNLLTDPVYQRLNQLTERLIMGMQQLAQKFKIGLYAHHIGSMFGFLFTDQSKIKNYDDVARCNVKLFQHFFHHMLKQGIYFAPSAFESGFVSLAHDEKIIDETLMAISSHFINVSST